MDLAVLIRVLSLSFLFVETLPSPLWTNKTTTPLFDLSWGDIRLGQEMVPSEQWCFDLPQGTRRPLPRKSPFGAVNRHRERKLKDDPH